MITTSTTRAEGRPEVVGAIRQAADRSGISFDYLYHQARLESGLNPSAAASSSSARGLYQFLDQTWLATVARHGAENGLGWAANAISRGANGRYIVADPELRRSVMSLRNDPQASSALAAAFASDNRDYLASRLQRPIRSVDLYIAHFLGPGGAVRFLTALASDPGQSAASLMPEAAAANRPIFYYHGRARSVAEVRDVLAVRMGANVAEAEVGGTPAAGLGMPAMPTIAPPRVIDPSLRSPEIDIAPEPYRMPTAPAPRESQDLGDEMSIDVASTLRLASMNYPINRLPRGTYASLAYMTLAQLGG